MSEAGNTDNSVHDTPNSKPAKSVGFAPPPEELHSHHKDLAKIQQEKAKSHPFNRIPPELAYLEKKGQGLGPKAIIAPEIKYNYAKYKISELGDLRNTSIKDISVQNKETELNFNYPTIDLFLSPYKLLVDTKFASLQSFDLAKINKYLLNLSNTKLGLGFEFSGLVIRIGSGIKDFEVGDIVVGAVDPLSRKGSLSTSILVTPGKDSLIRIKPEDLDLLEKVDVELHLDGKTEDTNFAITEDDGNDSLVVETIEDEGDATGNAPQESTNDTDNSDEQEPSSAAKEAEEENESEPVEAKETPAGEESLDKFDSHESIPIDSKFNEIKIDELEASEAEKSDAPAETPKPEASAPHKADGAKSTAQIRNALHKKSQYTTTPEFSALAKASTFPALYCRAKSVLSHLNVRKNKANVLINGADTNLGLTLVQILASKVYNLDQLNLILIIRESQVPAMKEFANLFSKGEFYDPSRIVKISLVTHDMANEELALPGRKAPTTYKKLDFFASQVIEGLFKTQYYDDDKLIGLDNIDDYKLDLFVDIVGCKKYFQHTIKFDNLDSIKLPIHDHTSNTLDQLFNGKVKEPFIVKLLKPKKSGSSFVSCCRFTVSEPTYRIEKLLESNDSSLWGSKWSNGILNTMTYYNYYEEIDFRVSDKWVREGLDLLVEGKLKFRLDHFIDWRNDFKTHIKELWADDGKILFKVEDF